MYSVRKLLTISGSLQVAFILSLLLVDPLLSFLYLAVYLLMSLCLSALLAWSYPRPRYLPRLSLVGLTSTAATTLVALLVLSFLSLPPVYGFHVKALLLLCLAAYSFPSLALVLLLAKLLSSLYYLRNLLLPLYRSTSVLITSDLSASSMTSRSPSPWLVAVPLLPFAPYTTSLMPLLLL